jgi:hypothetical protein
MEQGETPPGAFYLHVIETAAGVSLACLLGLAFVSTISTLQKVSACCFSLQLPLFLSARFMHNYSAVVVKKGGKPISKAIPNVLCTVGYILALFGMSFLIWSIYWLAGFIFFGICHRLVRFDDGSSAAKPSEQVKRWRGLDFPVKAVKVPNFYPFQSLVRNQIV